MTLLVLADALRLGLETLVTRVRDASVLDRSAAALGELDAHAAALGWTSGALGLLPFGFGLFVIGVALGHGLRHFALGLWGRSAVGVAGKAWRTHGIGAYAATIRFPDPDGRIHAFEARFDGTNDPTGRAVALRYRPSDPARTARARTGAPVLAELCLALLLGVVFVAAGLEGGLTPPPF